MKINSVKLQCSLQRTGTVIITQQILLKTAIKNDNHKSSREIKERYISSYKQD